MVLVDLDRRVPMGFAPSRQQADMKKVLKEWGEAVLSQIVEVSIDLSGNYKSLVHQMLPNAAIVADRFHVMKIVNEDLDRSRKALHKANQENPNAVKKSRIEAALKQSKYVLLKPEENLTQKQKVKLEEIRKVVPSLAQMHFQKETFRAIFEQAENWRDGTFQLLDWLVEAQGTFKQSVKTICRWFGEVTEYFEHRTMSAAVEGINNSRTYATGTGRGENDST